MSATRTTRVQHECHTNDTSVTRVGNFDFDKDTSENMFSHAYISYMANERLQGEEQFHSKYYLLELTSFPCQNTFEKCTAKIELCNGKSYIKKLHTRL